MKSQMPQSDQGITHDRYMLIPRKLIFLRRGESILLLKGASANRLWAGKCNAWVDTSSAGRMFCPPRSEGVRSLLASFLGEEW